MARSITLIPARAANEVTENNGIVHIQKKKVAAYCRVSTDQDEQLNSFEAQRSYYTEHILSNPNYELAGIFADEGISGTNTKNREQFNAMIKACKEGKIDLILTKSISRFARNTLDCLNYVRELKQLGIGIYFEKENIDTLDAKGEVLLTILSSLAQEESRSISENSTWGVRRRFEQGKVTINETKFLGYEKDRNGNIVIDRKQALIIKRIYREFLQGKGTGHITKDLEKDKVKNWNGTTKWYTSTIESILQNEKYKGDALLQKSYTVDFLSKKRAKNHGEVTQYYVEESHPAIIDPEAWEAVQLEFERRRKFCEEHFIKKLDTRVPFSGKLICSQCGNVYGRKTWIQPTGVQRKVWMCSTRYKTKGVKGCGTGHVDEETLKKVFVEVFNALVDNRQCFIEKWQQEMADADALKKYRLKELVRILEHENKMTEFNESICMQMLKQIDVVDDKKLLIVHLLDDSSLECEM